MSIVGGVFVCHGPRLCQLPHFYYLWFLLVSAAACGEECALFRHFPAYFCVFSANFAAIKIIFSPKIEARTSSSYQTPSLCQI